MKCFRNPLFAVIASLLLIFSTGCNSRAIGEKSPPEWEPGKEYELVLLHTNDHHGSILPHNGRGGLAERAAFIETVRKENDNVLLVSCLFHLM